MDNMNSSLIRDQDGLDHAGSLDPPDTLYINDSNAVYPSALEEDGKGDVASDYDLCMVFDVEEGTTQLPQHAINFCRKMIDNGLDIFLFYGIQKLHVFVLIRASFEVSCFL